MWTVSVIVQTLKATTQISHLLQHQDSFLLQYFLLLNSQYSLNFLFIVLWVPILKWLINTLDVYYDIMTRYFNFSNPTSATIVFTLIEKSTPVLTTIIGHNWSFQLVFSNFNFTNFRSRDEII